MLTLFKSNRFAVPVCLILIVAGSFFLKTYFSLDNVFQNPIRYAADDGVYHMRLVENQLIGGHFPKRIYFDPYTHFPNGTYIHFAPFYDIFLSAIVWIASLGQPTLEVIHLIAPFYPPLLGSLTVLVVFFIGKIMWGNFAGLWSALLIAISQPFVFRSLLGATDHHQAEALFSSLAILLAILAFKTRGENKLWIYSILGGIGLGTYFLFWPGALLFLFIIFASICLYYLVEYLSGRTPNWILTAGGIIFLITLIMILPFSGVPDIWRSPLYNINHFSAIGLGVFGFLILFIGGRTFKKTNLPKLFFPLLLLNVGLFFLVILSIFFPGIYGSVIESASAINTGYISQKGPVEWREHARQLIGEMAPLTMHGAFGSFGYLFWFAFLGIGFQIYNFFKKRRPENILMAIWFLTTVIITGSVFTGVGSNKYNYYLAVIIALLIGFLIAKSLRFGWSGFKNWRKEKNPYQLAASTLIVFCLVYFIFDPLPFPHHLTDPFPHNLPHIFARTLDTAINGSIQRHPDWYETLAWLKESTPDPGVDYYQFYQGPKYNPETEAIKPYPYPDSAYGIMSTWDVGHMITYYAHRIPNSNPFQQGLGRITEDEIIPGEAVFFIETKEDQAAGYLDDLGTKYVITESGMVQAQGAFYGSLLWAKGDTTGYFLEDGEYAGAPTRMRDKSMSVRLHYFDGREWQIEDTEESYVKYLDHFRLVYESKTPTDPSYFEEETADPSNDIRMIKVFEYVPGAKIQGRAPNSSVIEISTTVATNQGREFVYRKSAEVENGEFEFILPYSTEGKAGWIENGTRFDVFADHYTLKIGNQERIVDVTEEKVINGETIIL